MSASDYDVTITGGAYSTEANYADMQWVASRAVQLAQDLHTHAVEVSSTSWNDSLDGSEEVAPDTYAAVEAAIHHAVHDPGGMFSVEAAIERRAEDLRTAIRNYEDADSTMSTVMNAVTDYLGGVQQGMQAPLTLAHVAAMVGLHGDAWLDEHPGIFQSTIAAAASGPANLFGVSDVTGFLSEFWGDGEGSARFLGTADDLDLSDEASTPPSGLGNIMQSLARRDQVADENSDQIDIRRVSQPDGTVAYIVDIPGTAEWNFLPDLGLAPNENPNDLTTNVAAMAGQSTARQEAIAAALRDAGVTEDDPVMLVGHSQGGIVATQAAADSADGADGAFDFNVTHVVTAGSPVATADIPPDVQVLSLENEGDIVPGLDGADNAADPNRTTVRFDDEQPGGDDHGLGEPQGGRHENYVAVAQVLDSSDDPAIRAYIESASNFIVTDPQGATVTVSGYELTRD